MARGIGKPTLVFPGALPWGERDHRAAVGKIAAKHHISVNEDLTLKRHTTEKSLLFYNDGQLTNIQRGNLTSSVIRHRSLPLAERYSESGTFGGKRIATDDSGSVFLIKTSNMPNVLSYAAYGYCPTAQAQLSLLAYNGEYVNATGTYLLGNGYRCYNPSLMRFHSADDQSPFDAGGVNAYAYCEGDPINKIDPSGHSSIWNFFTNKSKRPTSAERLEAAHLPLKDLAQAKQQSLSKTEYNKLKKNMQITTSFLTRKVKQYKAINAPNYGSKTAPGNTRTEGIKLSQYKTQLGYAIENQETLETFKKITLGGKERYMTQANQESYLKLLTKDTKDTASDIRKT